MFVSLDPQCEKYYSISPYAYCAGNPVRYVDIKGQDIILVIWASYNGKIGHAGIAISNYRAETKRVKVDGKWTTKTNMIPDGTYTYRDLWPSEAVGKTNYNESVPASYNSESVTLDELLYTDVTASEGQAADGVIQFSTDYQTDTRIQHSLDSFEEANPSYNSLTVNCSDYVENALETMTGKQLPVDEKLTSRISATTPNQVYKTATTLNNRKVLKNAGNKVDNGFIRSVTGGGVLQLKAEEKLKMQ